MAGGWSIFFTILMNFIGFFSYCGFWTGLISFFDIFESWMIEDFLLEISGLSLLIDTDSWDLASLILFEFMIESIL